MALQYQPSRNNSSSGTGLAGHIGVTWIVMSGWFFGVCSRQLVCSQASRWRHVIRPGQPLVAHRARGDGEGEMTFIDTAQCADLGSEGPRHRQTLRQGDALCLSRWYRLRLPQTNKQEVVHGVVSLDAV